MGECPERQRGRTVNPLAYAFVGSSPTSPTSSHRPENQRESSVSATSRPPYFMSGHVAICSRLFPAILRHSRNSGISVRHGCDTSPFGKSDLAGGNDFCRKRSGRAQHTSTRPPLEASRPWEWQPSFRIRSVSSKRGLVCASVPTNTNTCAPNCAAAGGVNARTDCARCCRAIICTPMNSAVDSSDAHRCQWAPNSGVRSIN